MTDLAILFAGRTGIEPTMVVTPANADIIRPTVNWAAKSGQHVNILTYPFPSVGLPPGVENLGSADPSEAWRVYKAVDLAQDAHEELLRQHCPDAVVADIPFWWTTDVAAELGIPRITYHGAGVFPQLVLNNLMLLSKDANFMDKNSDGVITVPNLPGLAINMPISELPEFLLSPDHVTKTWDKMKASQLESYGVVVNTFYELEPEYCNIHRAVDAKQAYYAGPYSLSNGADMANSIQRGGDTTEVANQCITWLDAQKEASVIFICFGSYSRFPTIQLHELAIGLEKSGQPFIWVVRGTKTEGHDQSMPDGWENMISNRGFIIKGWAPQVAILGHKSVGAFLTHCGWNSTMEAIAAGVPVLTWPLSFEQFINERLLVEVMGIGARVCRSSLIMRSTTEEKRDLVPREVIRKAISQFMEFGETGDVARAKAKKYADMARAAVQEGGSHITPNCVYTRSLYLGNLDRYAWFQSLTNNYSDENLTIAIVASYINIAF
ncbi:hypothetical protein LUZ60_005595 [Juncus effusus]|nr:hypothetical protein LUZ60_005595 [Juncus effusus]